MESSDRKKRGGGVGIVVREDDIRYQIKQRINDNNLQMITLELNCKTEINVSCV